MEENQESQRRYSPACPAYPSLAAGSGAAYSFMLMDVLVSSGATRTVPGTSLISLSFPSPAKERAFLLLHVKAEPREAHMVEEECTHIIQSSLLQSEGESWHRLDGTLKELNGLFKGFLVSRTVEDIHALVALLDSDGILHVSHAGRSEAYLIRGSAASQITEGNRGKAIAMFVHISSGALEQGDSVLFATQRLLRAITPAQLRELALRGDQLLNEVVGRLDAEREMAALATLHIVGPPRRAGLVDTPAILPRARVRERSTVGTTLAFLSTAASATASLASSAAAALGGNSRDRRGGATARRPAGPSPFLARVREAGLSLSRAARSFLADLRHPERKRRAHLLLLAGGITLFLVLWVIFSLTANTQRSKTRVQLTELMQQIEQELQTADNRRISGDSDGANAILQHAEEQAKEIINNPSSLFRSESLTLLDKIRAKKEELNNIVRVPTRVVVNVASRNGDVSAHGLIGIADGEFIVYDRQQWYHVLLNGVEEGKRLSDEGYIIDGAAFLRQKSQVFLTTGDGVVELESGQPLAMKTDDTNGWVSGKDIEAYLRYLYILTNDSRIMKYERLNNRYGPGVQYNVTGDLAGSMDMAIDGSIYTLKENGVIVKMLRGEVKPFTISHGPEDVLKDASRLFKLPDGNFYVLDPVRSRVIVLSDGGQNGESSYLKQYILEGNQLGKLQDLYVDPDEAHLYVVDEKRVYVIDLGRR
ncbi:MAG: Uncharacterized protein Greene041619_142 [Candidatus Peregrinibacteria bacterium Greene0416_19]|nr:MAG: Uncharacterized protein Greene041619_142 [Candidatus Peregrinibacteria bacterium Greene0416_19]